MENSKWKKIGTNRKNYDKLQEYLEIIKRGEEIYYGQYSEIIGRITKTKNDWECGK